MRVCSGLGQGGFFTPCSNQTTSCSSLWGLRQPHSALRPQRRRRRSCRRRRSPRCCWACRWGRRACLPLETRGAGRGGAGEDRGAAWGGGALTRQQQRLGGQVDRVLGARDGLRDGARRVDAAQLYEARVRRPPDELRGARLALRADDDGLLVLQRLLDDEARALRILLRDLLRLDGLLELCARAAAARCGQGGALPPATPPLTFAKLKVRD